MAVIRNAAGDFDFNGGSFIMGPNSFPPCVLSHLLNVPDTLNLQNIVAPAVVAAGFPPPDALKFVQQVCRWGGKMGFRIAGRVASNNTPAAIAAALQNTSIILAGAGGMPPIAAVPAVNAINGLGLAFGSKVLRFLAPGISGVLDSGVAGGVGYPATAQGWVEYSRDCIWVAGQLTALGFGDPANPGGAWRAADVDMAIFARLHNWCWLGGAFYGCGGMGRTAGKVGVYDPKSGMIGPWISVGSGGNIVLVAKVSPKTRLPNDVDDWFKRLRKAIEAEIAKGYKITEVVFIHDPKGVPIPEWFRKWCSEIGIRIRFVQAPQPG